MFDEDAGFGFDTYCPVCDRIIELPTSTTQINSDQPDESIPSTSTTAAVPTLSQSSKSNKSHNTKRTSSIGANRNTSNALGQRRKSTTKLHSTKHSKSSTAIHSLAPSTAIHPVSVPPAVEVVEVNESSLNPPSSLYCSEECRRIDEMRSRLAFAHLVPANNRNGQSNGNSNGRIGSGEKDSIEFSNNRRYSESNESSDGHSQSQQSNSRRYSNTSYSQASGSSYGNSHITQRTSSSSNYPPSNSSYLYHQNDSNISLPPPASGNSNSATLPTLDFSTRRNSRGSNTEGSYPYYRDSVMRRSTDSLTSLSNAGDSDIEKSNYGGSFRPPSALSSLRFMTPISTPAPNSSSTTSQSNTNSTTTRRPSQLLRHHTDVPKATIYSNNSSSNGNGTNGKKVRDPPLSSPKIVGGTESDPERVSTRMNRSISNSSSHSSPPQLNPQSNNPSSSFSSSITISRKPIRNSSSASLSLMSSSFDPKTPSWNGPKRSDSTASLSGLVAMGKIIPVSDLPTLIQSKTVPTTDFSNNSRILSGRKSNSSAISSNDGSVGSPPEFGSPPSPLTRGSRSRSRNRSSVGGVLSILTPSTSSLFSSNGSNQSLNGENGIKEDHLTRMNGGRKGSSTSMERTPTQSNRSSGLNLDSEERSYSSSNVRSLSNSDLNITMNNTHWNGITGFSKLKDSSSSNLNNDNTATIKRRTKESRAMSTPSTVKRPTFFHSTSISPISPISPNPNLHPSNSTTNNPNKARLPLNATGVNPSLSHLHLDDDSNPSGGVNGGPNGGGFGNKSRNWSWDHLVPTYPVLDLDKVRREKYEKERGMLNGGVNGGGEGQGGNEGMLSPPVVKERKRLFYFSDANDHE